MSDQPHAAPPDKDATLTGSEIHDNMQTLRIVTSTHEAAAPDAQEAEVKQAVASVPREIFNYAVIAFVCLLVGGIVGWTARTRMSADNDAVIDRAVQTVVAAVPRGPTAVPTRDPNVRYDVSEAGNPAKGVQNPDEALVTIIEFGDFRCGFCRRFSDETLPLILDTYEGQVRYVFRDYPILTAESYQAAMAAECADDQGAFWAFHDWAYANQNALNRDGFMVIAENLGLNMDQFTTCVDGQIYNQEVSEDFNAGRALGITGTPTFFINGKILIGAEPFAVFQQRIDAELASIAEATAQPT
jgi:protein-disulfide isomerase